MNKSSIQKLQSCDKKLKNIMILVDAEINIQVIEGRRTLERQAELLRLGKSKTLDSKHVTGEKPSRAIDIAPMTEGKIDWADTKSFYILADKVFEIAEKLDTKIRWGGNFHNFPDLVHFELI